MLGQGKKRRNCLSKGYLWLGSGRNSSDFIRWFTDGERRYGTALWKLASVRLKAGESHPDYGRRKVWREGLEVAMKIKSSQGYKRVEWVKIEHPFTALSPVCVLSMPITAEAQNSTLRRRASAYP